MEALLWVGSVLGLIVFMLIFSSWWDARQRDAEAAAGGSGGSGGGETRRFIIETGLLPGGRPARGCYVDVIAARGHQELLLAWLGRHHDVDDGHTLSEWAAMPRAAYYSKAATITVVEHL